MPTKMKINKYKIIKRCLLIIIFTLAAWEGILIYRGVMGLNEPSTRAIGIARIGQLKQLYNYLISYKTYNLYDLYKQGVPLFCFINPLTQYPADNNKISRLDFEKICNYYIVYKNDNSWMLYEKKSDYTKNYYLSIDSAGEIIESE